METLHTAVANLSAATKKPSKVKAELQQGVFNDVNEIGTSKIKRRLANLEKRNPGVFERRAKKRKSSRTVNIKKASYTK
jgi:hypothetical protein